MTAIDLTTNPADMTTGPESVAHAYCTRCCSRVAACGFIRPA